MSFTVKDSGSRQQFSSGMVRDTQQGKTLYHLLFDGPMYDRWAEHLTKGAAKYDEGNWLQAQGDEELRRFKASAARHFRQWMRGDTDEDHAAAVFFNINGVEYVRGKTGKGSNGTRIVAWNPLTENDISDNYVHHLIRPDNTILCVYRNKSDPSTLNLNIIREYLSQGRMVEVTK